MATDIGPMVATACFRAISSPLGRSTNPAMKKRGRRLYSRVGGGYFHIWAR